MLQLFTNAVIRAPDDSGSLQIKDSREELLNSPLKHYRTNLQQRHDLPTGMNNSSLKLKGHTSSKTLAQRHQTHSICHNPVAFAESALSCS